MAAISDESTNVHSNPNHFTKQLEDLEKDIRKLRSQIGMRGGSFSDYSSISDGADADAIQEYSNYHGGRNPSPDTDSLATNTDEDEVNRVNYSSRQRQQHRSWEKQWTRHSHSMMPPNGDDHSDNDFQSEYNHVVNGGKFR